MLFRSRLIAARHISVLIFPEGGRAATGQLQAFRDGAFFLAIKSGAPVLPVARRMGPRGLGVKMS